jgi:acetyl esterase/lipase
MRKFLYLMLASILVWASLLTISPARVRGVPLTAVEAAQLGHGSDTPDTVEQNVSYGPGVLRLDIYKPDDSTGGDRPAIILIHGGGWTGYDKSLMKGMAQFLARSGFVAFAVDYRLLQGTTNRWPAQLDDVQRAVRWIRANAHKYGVNPDRIGAFGHSAGAQLASLLGMEETRDNSDPELAKFSSRVQAVVDYSGPTDFTSERDADSVTFLTNFLGTDYEKHPEVWRDASPAFHAAKSDAAFLIIHGTHDENVPLAEAEELHDKLKAAGAQVSFKKMDDGHTFQNPDSRRELAIATLEFFNHYLVVAR